MAWALKFLGTANNYSELDTVISELGGGDWRVEFTFQSFRAISENCLCISGDSINDMLGYHYNGGTQSVGWRKDGNWEYFGSGIDPVSSAITIKAERVGSTTSIYVDNVLQGTSTRVNYGNIEFCGGAIRGSGQANFPAAQEVQFLKIQSPTIDVYLDATASDHSNTGQQPVLVDTVGSNDATGLNFPTDGSAWVDLGGGSITGDIINSQSQQDTINSTVSINATLQDSQAQLDFITGNVVSPGVNGSITDLQSQSDFVSGSTISTGSLSDSQSQADGINGFAQLSSSITDSQGQSDNISGSVAISSAISDTQSQLENITGIVLLSADINDTQSQIDNLIGAVGDVVFGDITDSQSQVDNISSSAIISGSAIDFQSQASSINAGVTVSALVSDNQSQIDNITGFVSGGPITGSMTDEQGQLDQLSGLVIITANLTDSQGQIDSINERTIIYDGGYTARIDGQTFYSATIDAQTYYTAKIG